MKPIGQRIKELRSQFNMSQTELASKVNINERTVRKLESCDYNTTLYLIRKVLNVFGYDVAYENNMLFLYN